MSDMEQEILKQIARVHAKGVAGNDHISREQDAILTLIRRHDQEVREKLEAAIPKRIFRMTDEDLQDHDLQARVAVHNSVIDQIEVSLGIIEKPSLMPNFDPSSPAADKLRSAILPPNGEGRG